MKISFDFDDCLSEEYIQSIAKSLVRDYHDVWVITSRWKSPYHSNPDILKLCDEIGINKDHIIITDGQLKWEVFIKEKFDVHFDNDWEEVNMINIKGGKAILVNPDFVDIYLSMQSKSNEKLQTKTRK